MIIRAFLFASLFMGFGMFATCQAAPKPVEITSPLMIKEGGDKPIVVAVVDTGFDFNSDWKDTAPFSLPKLCKKGHKDFTGYGIQDVHGHGTHVAGLIGKEVSDINYCIVSLKFFHMPGNNPNELNSRRAFMRAIDLKVDIISYSGGGTSYDVIECTIIKRALDQGIIVVAAAGNENSDINKSPFYPAMCDDRVIAVANYDAQHHRQPSSNYSEMNPGEKVLFEENGVNVLSLSPGNSTDYMTGTSQSTAIRTGKMIRQLYEMRNWRWHYYRAIPQKQLDA